MGGNVSSLLWIGETGWSYPKAHTLDTQMKWCSDWSTTQSFTEYYTNFLDWDMTMNGYPGPDHVFYFSMRDSANFGITEGFGLVGDGDPTQWCSNTTCKLQMSAWSGTTTTTSFSGATECCWNRWGHSSVCGDYPRGYPKHGDGKAGLCNIDWATRCTARADCYNVTTTSSSASNTTSSSVATNTTTSSSASTTAPTFAV